jgi:hypothetical protein
VYETLVTEFSLESVKETVINICILITASH